MPSETQRVMVAMQDDAARKLISDNLQADGYEPIAASGLGHAISRLPDHVDAVIIDLSLDTLKLLDAVRAGAYPTVDSQLPTVVLTDPLDRFHSIRLLEHGADDVLCEASRLRRRLNWHAPSTAGS